MKCKNCEQREVVKYSKYSSGEFCSRECARAYSTKAKRSEINERVSEKLSGRKLSADQIKKISGKNNGKYNHDISDEERNRRKNRKKRGAIIKVYKTCLVCDKNFYAGNKGNKETKKRRFCSHECANEAHSKHMAIKASQGLIKNKGKKCEYSFKNKLIHCDSKIEYACLDFFEKNHDVINIKRSSVIIEYKFEGKIKRYNPDFEIKTIEDYFIIECKTIIKNNFLNEKWRKYNEVSKIKKIKLKEYAKENNIKNFWFTKDLHRKFYDNLKI